MVSRALAAALLLGACAAPAPGDRASSALGPAVVIRGARLEASGAYTPLVNPVAVAGVGSELYVADAGLAMLLRVDPPMSIMVPVVRRAFAPGTRLAADADGTLYVLDPVERRVRRYARNGRLLGDFVADATVGVITDLVLDTARGRVIAADSLNRQLVAFHPLGRAFEVIPVRASERDRLLSIGGLAGGRDTLYASDPRCGCLARLGRDGRVAATFGHGDLRQPGRLVVDRFERVIVADEGLKVFSAQRLVQTIPGPATDLALADDWLYVADQSAALVRALRVLPP